MPLSVSALLFGINTLVEGKVSARTLAHQLQNLPPSLHGDDQLALREALLAGQPALEDSITRLSIQSNFVPVRCKQCGGSFRAHRWQMHEPFFCPRCEAAVTVPRVLLGFDHLNLPIPARRAAETEPDYKVKEKGVAFAHFRLFSLIGTGGTGRVFEAVNTRNGRRVAVKIFKFSPLEPQSASVHALLREASLAAAVRHPHIIRVHRIGLAEGIPFVEMELVEGGSLRDRVEQRGPIQWQEACALTDQVLGALECAHTQKVIHRDLKPGNVLLDRKGKARVSDFGLSRLADETSSTGSRIVGSPHFMAPEQWTGGPVGTWTDLYAVGLMLYYMIVGDTPFGGHNMLSVMYQHLHVPVPDPSEKVEDVPTLLLSAMRKAAAKVAEDRFCSAADFRLALQCASG